MSNIDLKCVLYSGLYFGSAGAMMGYGLFGTLLAALLGGGIGALLIPVLVLVIWSFDS